jgi:RimJ/RimL family protein N-acetyltransferase
MNPVTLRPWKAEDLNVLVRFADNANIAKWLTNTFPHPYTRDDGIRFLQNVTAFDPPRVLAICFESMPVGSIGIFPQTDIFSRNAELGYWLAEEFWGKGIMPEAIIQMCEYGFSTFEIDRIYARPFGTNIPSQRVLEKTGFILEARFESTIFKNGDYHDELVYAVRK